MMPAGLVVGVNKEEQAIAPLGVDAAAEQQTHATEALLS
jgi:hypothetical protein